MHKNEVYVRDTCMYLYIHMIYMRVSRYTYLDVCIGVLLNILFSSMCFWVFFYCNDPQFCRYHPLDTH